MNSSQNLVTAVGMAVCRHGMLLRLLNLFTGERHAYATAVAHSLLGVGTSVAFWWYDIACRCVLQSSKVLHITLTTNTVTYMQVGQVIPQVACRAA